MSELLATMSVDSVLESVTGEVTENVFAVCYRQALIKVTVQASVISLCEAEVASIEIVSRI